MLTPTEIEEQQCNIIIEAIRGILQSEVEMIIREKEILCGKQ